jgi:carbon-monoxide dehydrogenase large subunit
MIVQGQVHGGLTQGIAPAMYEELIYDEDGNILNGTLMDYLVPTAWSLQMGNRPRYAIASHPVEERCGESPTVGAPPAIIITIVDALSWHHTYGYPVTPNKIFN